MKNPNRTLNILKIEGSARSSGSITRTLTAEVVEALEAQHGEVSLVTRDLADGIGLIDERWIAANFTPDEERNDIQRAALAESDALVEELKAANILVIGAPIYNFGVPAALKAWVDMIARARLTFRYSDKGPVGLLKGKKAYVVIASGGTPVDSEIDFATPYLRHALRFIGITDIVVIAADRGNVRGTEALDAARMQIADSIYTRPLRPASAV